jgi:hypothetical protein
MRKILLAIIFAFSTATPKLAVAGGSGSQLAGTAVTLGLTYVVINAEAGTKLAKLCDPTFKIIFCIMAAAAVGQAAGDLVNSGTNKKTVDKFSGGAGAGDGDFAGENGGGVDHGPGAPDPTLDLHHQIDNTLALLAKKGFKVDPKTGTLTDPKGKSHDLSSLGSGKAMADQGLIGAGDIAAADAEIKKLQDKMKVVSMGIGGGGGGGSGSKGNSYAYEDPYKSLFAKEKAKAGTNAGMTRTLASGESIGSQGDDIFQMITRRYQQKADEKIFVGQQPTD